MKLKEAAVRVEKIRSLLFVIEVLREGQKVLAVKALRGLTGLSIRESATAIAIALGEGPQGEVSEEAKEVGLLLKKFL